MLQLSANSFIFIYDTKNKSIISFFSKISITALIIPPDFNWFAVFVVFYYSVNYSLFSFDTPKSIINYLIFN